MGFIPFARTNLSQACKSFESANNIFGRCKNPWNMKRTPGGSSGGESGMLAGGCSVFGLASDIGGSARIPSSFCGLYTLMSHRNSKKSTSYFGKFASGVYTIKSSFCPITKSVDDIALYFN
jgi:Asp-tRNA(Asn)/Glu-tRNA(Gln) amidotransferase A subunit family amidase